MEKGKDGGSGFPYVGGTDAKPTREERRAARKKAKRCKGVAPGPASYLEAFDGGVAASTDPDRPAAKRMEQVEAFEASVDPSTLLVPIAKQKPRIPVLPKASCLYSDPGYPSYFGKGEDDEDAAEEAEGFANYSAVGAADDPTYRLDPDFMKTFQLQGAQKAAGGGLPAPNLNDSWKPLVPGAATYTAFLPEGEDPVGPGKADQSWALSFLETAKVPGAPASAPDSLPRAPPITKDVAGPGPERQRATVQRFEEEKMVRDTVVPAGGNPKEDKDLLLARIDALMGRIEALEQKKGQDTQQELLLFVGGGIALLLSFQLLAGGGSR